MLKNILINREAIKQIAAALDNLSDQVIYVGGAVVSLYINDPSAEDVRPTKDVDISLSIASLGELENLRQQLIKKGFIQTAEEKVMCRFEYAGIKVDVMSTKAVGWAPANSWFEPGFRFKQVVDVDDQKIQILPLSYYLASKFEAFDDRGSKDPRTSQDFEDIVYILDNRKDLTEEIFKYSDDEVRKYLRREFIGMQKDKLKQEAILCNLSYEIRDIRFQQIIDNLKLITDVL
ncbi:MAG: hypothetical protein QME58_03385 [Bacteroidota bacterium]|nr:hypothetical protein [Bacteroidota bacterium]